MSNKGGYAVVYVGYEGIERIYWAGDDLIRAKQVADHHRAMARRAARIKAHYERACRAARQEEMGNDAYCRFHDQMTAGLDGHDVYEYEPRRVCVMGPTGEGYGCCCRDAGYPPLDNPVLY